MSIPKEPSFRESVDLMFNRAVALMDLPPGLEGEGAGFLELADQVDGHVAGHRYVDQVPGKDRNVLRYNVPHADRIKYGSTGYADLKEC